MKNRVSRILLSAVILALCATGLAVPASFAAETKVTFNNKLDRSVFVALCWVKPRSATEGVWWKKGWYKVESGKSRTITLQNIQNLFGVGYYAQTMASGGQKKLIWQGTSKNFQLAGDIHPTKEFDTSECSIDDGMEVRFRKIDLKEKDGMYVATLNLSE